MEPIRVQWIDALTSISRGTLIILRRGRCVMRTEADVGVVLVRFASGLLAADAHATGAVEEDRYPFRGI